MEFVAVVADLPENTDGATLPPTLANLSFDDGSGRVSEFSGSIAGISVVEPNLAVSKTIVGPSAADGLDGSGFVYEVAVFHSKTSTSVAYDVVLSISSPKGRCCRQAPQMWSLAPQAPSTSPTPRARS